MVQEFKLVSKNKLVTFAAQALVCAGLLLACDHGCAQYGSCAASCAQLFTIALLSLGRCQRSLLLLLLLLLLLCAGGRLASRLDDYAAVSRLSTDEWRQHRRQEAAWQAAMRQELAALQAEGGDV